jgi:hypothetical protein
MMGKTAYEKTLKYKNYVLTGINKEDMHFFLERKINSSALHV